MNIAFIFQYEKRIVVINAVRPEYKSCWVAERTLTMILTRVCVNYHINSWDNSQKSTKQGMVWVFCLFFNYMKINDGMCLHQSTSGLLGFWHLKSEFVHRWLLYLHQRKWTCRFKMLEWLSLMATEVAIVLYQSRCCLRTI